LSRSQEPHLASLPYKWHNHDKFNFFQMDLNHDADRIIELIGDSKAKYIVNFAAQSMVAQSWDAPEDWYQTNLLANVRLFEGLRKLPIKKYVHISTPEVYGSCEGVISENTNYKPSTPYATSRAACDMHLLNLYRNYGFPVVFTRAANVYGSGQQLYRIIPRTILFIKMKNKLQLHGGGTSVRSFIHINDVADGTLKAVLNASPPEIFHFSTKRFVSIKELVEIICRKMYVDINDVIDAAPERPGKDLAYTLDCHSAKHKLNWEPQVSLEEGIEETISWINQFYDELKEQPLNYMHKK